MLLLYTDNSKRSENLLKEQEHFSDEDPTSAAPVNGQQGDGPLKDAAKYGKSLGYKFKFVSECDCERGSSECFV